jgi:hypothetical protein
MANSSFSYTPYAKAQTYDPKNGGYQIYGNGYAQPDFRNDSVSGTRIRAVSPAQIISTAFGSVTINSVVEVLPTGLTVDSTIYLCSETFAALVTART